MGCWVKDLLVVLSSKTLKSMGVFFTESFSYSNNLCFLLCIKIFHNKKSYKFILLPRVLGNWRGNHLDEGKCIFNWYWQIKNVLIG